MCEGIMKIFVETGPGFDGCAAYRRIEVDLKGPGERTAQSKPLDFSASLQLTSILPPKGLQEVR